MNDATSLQLVKVSTYDGSISDDIERIQNYGFTSNPPTDSEAIVLYIGGRQDNGIVIVCDNATSRIKNLVSGESAMYSSFGQVLKHNADGSTSLQNANSFDVGNAPQPVAISSKVASLQNALFTVCNSFVPPSTPDGGASLSKVIAAAIQSITDFSSTNLRADG